MPPGLHSLFVPYLLCLITWPLRTWRVVRWSLPHRPKEYHAHCCPVGQDISVTALGNLGMMGADPCPFGSCLGLVPGLCGRIVGTSRKAQTPLGSSDHSLLRFLGSASCLCRTELLSPLLVKAGFSFRNPWCWSLDPNSHFVLQILSVILFLF